jgi:hypothetical protein
MRRCLAIARSPRVVSSPLLSTPSRSMAHGHGGPAKTLPPRPALPANASFGQKFEHTMWEKRHPGNDRVMLAIGHASQFRVHAPTLGTGEARVSVCTYVEVIRTVTCSLGVPLLSEWSTALCDVSLAHAFCLAAFLRHAIHIACIFNTCNFADYEGAESYLRYYLPENYQVTLMQPLCPVVLAHSCLLPCCRLYILSWDSMPHLPHTLS